MAALSRLIKTFTTRVSESNRTQRKGLHYLYQGNHSRFTWGRNLFSAGLSWFTRGIEFLMVMSTLLWAVEVNAAASKVYIGPYQWMSPLWLLPDAELDTGSDARPNTNNDQLNRSPSSNDHARQNIQKNINRKKVMRVERFEHATAGTATAPSGRGIRERGKLTYSILKRNIIPDPEVSLSPSYKGNPFYVPSDLTILRF